MCDNASVPRRSHHVSFMVVCAVLSASHCKKSRPGESGKPAGRGSIRFTQKIAWKTWAQAAAAARQRKQLICLVIYAEWCPRCRELPPLFEDRDIVRLARGFQMVAQNAAAKPGWLKRYQRYGTYVPRILFLDHTGRLREDLQSGHPRYPYFYSKDDRTPLKRTMLRAQRPD